MGHNIYMVLEFLARYVWPVATLVAVGWFLWRILLAILAWLGLVKSLPAGEAHPTAQAPSSWQAPDADDDNFPFITLPRAIGTPGSRALHDTDWLDEKSSFDMPGMEMPGQDRNGL